jgi:hypothetical protein
MAEIFDPRYSNLALSLTFLHAGQLPASHDFTFVIANGQGQVSLEPAQMPVIGTITQGKLVISSENFPRFAPLTVTLTGVDLRFHVRRRLLLNFEIVERTEPLLRLHCTGLWKAAYLYRLDWPADDQVTITRVNAVDNNRETALNIYVTKGTVEPSPGAEKEPDGQVTYGKVHLRRSSDGDLKLRMHGARMEADIRNGVVTGLRISDSLGAIASFQILDWSAAGVGMSVSLLDTLP